MYIIVPKLCIYYDRNVLVLTNMYSKCFSTGNTTKCRLLFELATDIRMHVVLEVRIVLVEPSLVYAVLKGIANINLTFHIND